MALEKALAGTREGRAEAKALPEIPSSCCKKEKGAALQLRESVEVTTVTNAMSICVFLYPSF